MRENEWAAARAAEQLSSAVRPLPLKPSQANVSGWQSPCIASQARPSLGQFKTQ